jgi:ATP-dependent Clp protease ATP-binding subunit ClpA
VFEKFDRPARRAVAGAQDEAMELGHDFIGTEHMLLGLARDPQSGAARVLTECGVTLPEARARTLRILQEHGGLAGHTAQEVKDALVGLGIDLGEIQRRADENFGPGRFRFPRPPFTPRCRRSLEQSLREARDLGHDQIGTEHLLLGVLAEDEAVAVMVLSDLGVQREDLRTRVLAQIAPQDS